MIKREDKAVRFCLEDFDDSMANLLKEIRAGNSCSVFGVQNSLRPAFVSSLNKKVLYLTSSDVFASSAVSSFELMGLKTCRLQTLQDEFLYKKAQSNEFYLERIKTLAKILSGNFDVVVAEVSALYSYLPSPYDFSNNTIKLKVNQDVDIFELEKKLIAAGYKKEEIISEQGQFSRRGEILDVFPISAQHPFRIDFFDTQIETIKVFDLASQKATKDVSKLVISPFCEIFADKNEIQGILKIIKNRIFEIFKITFYAIYRKRFFTFLKPKD